MVRSTSPRFLDQFDNIGFERVDFHPLDGKHYLLRKICVRYRQFRICQHKANTLIYGQQNVKSYIRAAEKLFFLHHNQTGVNLL